MIGLAALGLVILWLVVAAVIAWGVSRILPKQWWRSLLAIALFVVLVPLPVIDEIIGGIQFKQLCKEHDEIHVDRLKAKGRTVYLADTPDEYLHGVAVPVRVLRWRFVDATTGELIVSYDDLYAQDGWLVRFFGFWNSPVLFHGFCAPGGKAVAPNTLLGELGINRIERNAGEVRK